MNTDYYYENIESLANGAKQTLKNSEPNPNPIVTR